MKTQKATQDKGSPAARKNPRERPGPFRTTLWVLGIGLASQYVMSGGFPALGAAGYAVAIWIFLTRLEMDLKPRPGAGLDPAALRQELGGYARALRTLKTNWRRLSLAQIFQGEFEPSAGEVPQAEEPGGDTA